MTLGPLMVDVAGTALDAEEREMLRHPLIGSVILFTRNYSDPQQLAALVAEIHSLRSPPLIVGVDHEGGRVQRFRSGFSVLPSARRIGHEYDADAKAGLALARELGWLMAVELRGVGIDLSFAPCVDLDYGVSEVIGDRAFHARPAAVGELAVAYMHGMRDAHHAVPVDRRALEDLEPDLAPYRLLIANGIAGIMVAHVVFPAVDSLPASVSRRWVRGVLRDELRFQGVVFTDDLSMQGAAAAGDVVTRAQLALDAGCDVLPVCNQRASVMALLDGLKEKPDPASSLRLVRLRGRGPADYTALRVDERWQRSQQTLARCAAPPSLQLQA
jgi:beta-N-acetylhexosaminidase